MGDHNCPSTKAPGHDLIHPSPVSKHPNEQAKPKHPLENVAAPGISYYTPQQTIPAGTAITHPLVTIPKLFQPFNLRGLRLHNRIMVSPMCQYSAIDGHLTDWHLTHLGGILQRGPGLTIVEATAVTPEGRITPEDSGLWKDSQIGPLARIVEFAHSQNQKIAIQLAHAGRKASTVAPWIDRKAAAPAEVGGWPDNVLGASSVPFDENSCVPRTMTLEDIASFKKSFVDAVHRALKAGFDAIEIHAAHGYLLHSTLSAATNDLPAPYSGSLENRMRLLLETAKLVREAIPSSMPLLVRIPGTDWVEYNPSANGWEVTQCTALGVELSRLGVDFLDVSSAGLLSAQKITSGPGYQVPYAAAVKKALAEIGSETKVGTVGMITSGVQAETILQAGLADAVLVARPFQQNPGLVLHWAAELGAEVRAANQIGWGAGQRPGGGIGAKK